MQRNWILKLLTEKGCGALRAKGRIVNRVVTTSKTRPSLDSGAFGKVPGIMTPTPDTESLHKFLVFTKMSVIELSQNP